MNKELLLKVKQYILDNPDDINMETWAMLRDGEFTDLPDIWTLLSEKVEAGCGTVGCIAGWTCFVSTGELSKLPGHLHLSDAATNLLGLEEAEANKLFYLGKWPSHLERRYERAIDQEERAQVVADRIDTFIKDGI